MSTLLLPTDVALRQVVEFSYPDDNRIGVRTRMERRIAFVEAVRDTEIDPIEPWVIQQDPRLRRSRLLLTTQDLAKHEWRSFYFGSMRRIRRLDAPVFRLAFVDPFDECKPVFVGPLFLDTQADQRRMRERIRRFNRFSCQKEWIHVNLVRMQIN